MSKLENYNGSVQLMAGITQKGGEDFALIEANAIQVDENGGRLDEAMEKLVYLNEEDNENTEVEDPPQIQIDDKLSDTSTNPVQNKVITAAIAQKIQFHRQQNFKEMVNELLGAISGSMKDYYNAGDLFFLAIEQEPDFIILGKGEPALSNVIRIPDSNSIPEGPIVGGIYYIGGFFTIGTIDIGVNFDDFVKGKEFVEQINGIKIKQTPFNNGDTITMQNNMIYIANGQITNFAIEYPEEGNFICGIQFTTVNKTDGEGDNPDITITFPSTSKFIGGEPTFAYNETWELNIQNGIVVGGVVIE